MNKSASLSQTWLRSHSLICEVVAPAMSVPCSTVTITCGQHRGVPHEDPSAAPS